MTSRFCSALVGQTVSLVSRRVCGDVSSMGAYSRRDLV